MAFKHRFVVYMDNAGAYRWRFLADNNQVIAASSDGYPTPEDATQSIEIVREGDAGVEVYEDKAGEFRWRLKTQDGDIICTGGEGYTQRAACENGVLKTLQLAHSAAVHEDEATA